MILSFRADMPGQTVQTQIRLFLFAQAISVRKFRIITVFNKSELAADICWKMKTKTNLFKNIQISTIADLGFDDLLHRFFTFDASLVTLGTDLEHIVLYVQRSGVVTVKTPVHLKVYYSKSHKNSDPWQFFCKYPKIGTVLFYQRVTGPKDA